MNEQNQQAFEDETRELLCEMEAALLELEKSPEDGDMICRVFRALHTIKGGCGIFGHDYLAEFVHEVETIFDLVRSGKISACKELITLTLAASDHIRGMVTTSCEGSLPEERG